MRYAFAQKCRDSRNRPTEPSGTEPSHSLDIDSEILYRKTIPQGSEMKTLNLK
jgi:hypothetical protein